MAAGERVDPAWWQAMFEERWAGSRAGSLGWSRGGGFGRSWRAAGRAAPEELGAFTGSANHQLASGDAARHAREPGSGPTRTMSLDEGAQFIRDLVSRWLSSFT